MSHWESSVRDAEETSRATGAAGTASAVSALASRRVRWFSITVAVVFLVAHLPFLASTLEDVDSANFALGIVHFDPTLHRPHPPGYPVLIGLGKLAATVLPLPGAIAVWGAIGGALAVFPLVLLVASIMRSEEDQSLWFENRAGWVIPVSTTLAVMASPLYWFTASRPMSDVAGLAVALLAQALLAAAFVTERHARTIAGADAAAARSASMRSGRLIMLAVIVTAIGIGLRSQIAWLALPLVAVVLVDRAGRGAAAALVGSVIWFVAGVLAWAVPLVIASGGLRAYFGALTAQAGEDFSGVDMVFTHLSPRRLAFALIHTFVMPWSTIAIAVIVLALAAVGLAAMLLRNRRGVVLLAAAWAPYAVLHLAFQETITTRYALPLLVPVCLLAMRGLSAVWKRMVLPAAVVLAAWSLVLTVPALAQYARQGSPAMHALADIRQARNTVPATLVMHHVFFRCAEAEALSVVALPAPPKHEWLEAVKYWQAGGTNPVWFLADPNRTDLALIDPVAQRTRRQYSWPFASAAFMSGIRPDAAMWVEIASPPGWFLGEGWSLTPEAAGVAQADHRGPGFGPITAFIRRRPGVATLAIGGRHLGGPADAAARVSISIDDRPLDSWVVTPGFFLRFVDLPAGALEGPGATARLKVSASWAAAQTGGGGPPIAIEQFDLQDETQPVWGYDVGWQEPEYNPEAGRSWRWASERAVLKVAGRPRDLVLTVDGESPQRYHPTASAITIKAGSRTLHTERPGRDFTWTIPVPADALRESGGTIVFETSQYFVPAERSGGGDRRHLAVRVYGVRIRPAF